MTATAHTDSNLARFAPALASKVTLPAPPTPLVGRAAELTALVALLHRPTVRLVTVSGAPGVGKTRLALQVAATLATQEADVHFVALAVLRDPELLPTTIAQALGLQLASATSVFDQLLAHLRTQMGEQPTLLVLDNFEQVMGAATTIANLLAAAASIKILITSRTALHLSSEHEFSLAPLTTPDPTEFLANDLVTRYPSVALFVARAQAVRPDFQLTPGNAAVIAQICWHLEGLPLAIELAAARSKLLPPQALLARLTHRLATLTGGPRDLPERQQTLRSAIAWSYDLLLPEHKALLRALSVFAEGCTVEAAETILDFRFGILDLGDHGTEPVSSFTPGSTRGTLVNTTQTLQNPKSKIQNVLDGLAALLDHSLIQRLETSSGDVRFSMLELIREYAVEELIACNEETLIRRRHAEYYLRLAEQIEPQLYGPQQAAGLDQLEAEHANLRAALGWCASTRQLDLLLRLTLTLGQFWWRHGHFAEERHWLRTCLGLALPLLDTDPLGERAAIPDLPSKLAGVLYAAGAFAWHHGELEQAIQLCQQSLDIYRDLDQKRQMPRSMRIIALAAIDRGDFGHARHLLAESLAICRELGDQRGIAWSLSFLGRAAAGLGDHAQARSLLEDSLARFRQLGEKDGIIYQLQYLSDVAIQQGEAPRAQRLSEESLAMARQLGHKGAAADALRTLGRTAALLAQPRAALAHFKEALQLYQPVGNWAGTADCYDQLALIGEQVGQSIAADQLRQRARDLRGQIEASTGWSNPADLAADEQMLALIEQATQQTPPAAPLPPSTTSTPSTSSTSPSSELTQRESEVLRLISHGLTYVQIAEQLVVSPRTVDAHLRAIYSKLGVRSRHEAAIYARQHGLI